jgi:DNA-binding MarR family transcriptional regulator/GNAT superfamily N-acetyltransferase
MSKSPESILRSFSRCFTDRLGVLDESFLGQGRPLGLARLIFEVGLTGRSVSELRKKLRLDPGYLSRSLATLQQDGLLVITPDPRDGRRRMVELSNEGRREWEAIDRESNLAVARILDPLSHRQRIDLAASLSRAEQLLACATLSFDEVDPLGADAQWAMGRYVEELVERFDTDFDPGQAFMEGGESTRSSTDVFVAAYRDVEVVGCGGLQELEEGVGEIKRMWVAQCMRGLGIGRRLLGDLEARAAALGYTHTRLDTNTSLHEAIAMYESAGYRKIDRYNDNPYARLWFEKVLPGRAPVG